MRTNLTVVAAVAVATAVAGVTAAASWPTAEAAHRDHEMGTVDRSAAMVATARYQDVTVAEEAGWTSTIETLGCFQDDSEGGMGVHYVNTDLMDATVDITQPEALVYELDAGGDVAGLVAHEYIVPVESWSSRRPPRLFGMNFHRHPVLPLWVLHTWLWKDNVTGIFSDWNPAVRPCPAGAPVFGIDLPK